MFKNHKKKYFYLILSIISISIAIIGFFTLLFSPYLGIKFESKNSKWFITSISSDFYIEKSEELIGKEIIAIGDFRLKEFDLVEDGDYIVDRNSLTQFWKAQKYFAENIKIGVPVNLVIKLDS